jgi:hypothetical protein
MMIWVFEHVSGSSPSESLSEQESITWTLTLPAKKGNRPNKNTVVIVLILKQFFLYLIMRWSPIASSQTMNRQSLLTFCAGGPEGAGGAFRRRDVSDCPTNYLKL